MDLRAPIPRYFGFQFLRYAVIGVSMSILYVGLTTWIVEASALSPLAASIAAFSLSLPVAYLGHHYVTFRRKGTQRGQFLRFVLAMTNAFVVSTATMWLTVSVFRAHYAYALLSTTAIVTAINYAVLDAWVFSLASKRHGHAGGRQ